MTVPAIPLLRWGTPYESLDLNPVRDHRDGTVLARMSVANPGLLRRDFQKADRARAALSRHTHAELVAICARAAKLFTEGSLPLGTGGAEQSPDDYVRTLSATSGLPHTLCRRNMGKIAYVLANMDLVLAGLTRGLDLSVLDKGLVEQDGRLYSYFPTTNVLGAVLPNNSPGVHSLWVPALALKTPVFLKPGSEEPWTPWRMMQALRAAGLPAEAMGFYPTTHEGAHTIVDESGRAMMFGDQNTVERYRNRPEVSVHGPGWSKVIVGEDRIAEFPAFIDVIATSILANSGRSCVNASAVIVPSHGREVAEALAKRLAAIRPRSLDAPDAALSAIANPAMADYMDGAIDDGLSEPGAEDLTAAFRDGPRRVELEGSTFLHPTLIHCASWEHPLANREFLFPYASVVEMPQAEMLDRIGPTLVASAITRDEAFTADLLACTHIDRLNLGEIATPTVQWDQPHEGNLFEFLYRRRSIQLQHVS